MDSELQSKRRISVLAALALSVIAALAAFVAASSASQTFEARASVAIATPMDAEDLADERERLAAAVPEGELQVLVEQRDGGHLRIEVPDAGSQITIVGAADTPAAATALSNAGALLVAEAATDRSSAADDEPAALTTAEIELGAERTAIEAEIRTAIEEEAAALVTARSAGGAQRQALDGAVDAAIEERVVLVQRRDEVIDRQNVVIRDRHTLAVNVAIRPDSVFVVLARTPATTKGIRPIAAAALALLVVALTGLVTRWSFRTTGRSQ